MSFSFKIKEKIVVKTILRKECEKKMKFLEKFALTVYSYIVLILAVIMCLLVFNWMDVRIVTQTISMITQGDISSKITLGVSAIFILLSIKCIFFDSETEEKIKESQGILLKNENGQLLITKETLDNMIKSVVYKFDNIENCIPKISIDEQNEISITLQVVVKDNVIIKDLANSLQNKVKEEMKKTSDLDVKNVNIKIIDMSKKQEGTKE